MRWGPIDGLIYQTDTGFISAKKTADGIVLSGTVPNEEVRASLIESAQAATDAEVLDELTVSGPAAPWHDEAQFGLTQMGALTTGALTVSAGALSLSGTTAGDAGELNNSVTAREGWSSFVSAPSNLDALNADIARLSGDVSTRDGRIGALEGEVSGLEGEVTGLEGEVAKLEGEVSELEGEVATLEGEVTELGGDVTELKGQLSETCLLYTSPSPRD